MEKWKEKINGVLAEWMMRFSKGIGILIEDLGNYEYGEMQLNCMCS